jgi:hypothetical protein
MTGRGWCFRGHNGRMDGLRGRGRRGVEFGHDWGIRWLTFIGFSTERQLAVLTVVELSCGLCPLYRRRRLCCARVVVEGAKRMAGVCAPLTGKGGSKRQVLGGAQRHRILFMGSQKYVDLLRTIPTLGHILLPCKALSQPGLCLDEDRESQAPSWAHATFTL